MIPRLLSPALAALLFSGCGGCAEAPPHLERPDAGRADAGWRVADGAAYVPPDSSVDGPEPCGAGLVRTEVPVSVYDPGVSAEIVFGHAGDRLAFAQADRTGTGDIIRFGVTTVAGGSARIVEIDAAGAAPAAIRPLEGGSWELALGQRDGSFHLERFDEDAGRSGSDDARAPERLSWGPLTPTPNEFVGLASPYGADGLPMYERLDLGVVRPGLIVTTALPPPEAPGASQSGLGVVVTDRRFFVMRAVALATGRTALELVTGPWPSDGTAEVRGLATVSTTEFLAAGVISAAPGPVAWWNLDVGARPLELQWLGAGGEPGARASLDVGANARPALVAAFGDFPRQVLGWYVVDESDVGDGAILAGVADTPGHLIGGRRVIANGIPNVVGSRDLQLAVWPPATSDVAIAFWTGTLQILSLSCTGS